jgi:putative transposase
LDVLHEGRERVARLLRAAGLQGCYRRRQGLTRRNPQAVSAPDLVERRLHPQAAPNRLWVADITQ